MHNSEIKKRLDQTIENRLRLRWGLSYMSDGFWGWGGDIWGWGGGYLKPLRTLLLQEHLTVLKKADAEPKKGRSKKGHYRTSPLKNGLIKLPCFLTILVSWGDFFDIGLLLYPVQVHTMQCCNRKPFWVAEPEIVVLHRPFLILRLLQNIV